MRCASEGARKVELWPPPPMYLTARRRRDHTISFVAILVKKREDLGREKTKSVGSLAHRCPWGWLRARVLNTESGVQRGVVCWAECPLSTVPGTALRARVLYLQDHLDINMTESKCRPTAPWGPRMRRRNLKQAGGRSRARVPWVSSVAETREKTKDQMTAETREKTQSSSPDEG